MAETAVVKETKAQKMERLKREKNPWDYFDEVRQFAREGRDSVVPEWASAYFKWWGVYTQGDGVGVTGGKGGEGLATQYFMMRIGLPNGILRSDQLRVIADLTQRYARDLADITVRQNIQLHWLTIESLPEVVDALERVGLSPRGACGDVVRNVTGCPLAGLAADELTDASPLAIDLATALIGNSEFYNLPRKFKICATGCSSWCCYPEINDIAFTATRRGDQIGYSVRVGGGLSNEPHLAVKLDAWVEPGQVLDVARVITEIFRDQQALRESRDRARIKYLFLKEGWTAESFLAELHARLGYQLAAGVEEQVPDEVHRDHVGIHAQKQPGLSYVGASVLRGRLTGLQLHQAADLADRFGNGELRATTMQNLIFVNVPTGRAAELAREIERIGMRVEGSQFWRGGVACTGTEFCKLAITETKGFLRWLVDELEERLPAFDQQLKLHVTGCPNSCGQHWIADIGLEGKKIKHNGQLVDAYYFCVGGSVGKYAGVSRPVGYRAPATEVPAALERLLSHYVQHREPQENLRAWFSRHEDSTLRALLAGETVAPVERDLPTGRVPQGVAG
ncbi:MULTISPECIES: nitrite reductase [Acidobacterium]|uniref:Nitrite reductase n=1 Tax=Acidobacterium capsulatum (strain ATCC 51196 / DSM 11244 / BCRC 80197 / JCM 7670 / NBRC 15755 / NCIMB 13165 / 161) TaxID=240015 RepID=C1F4H7_ACIC5|nr:MULTISPECIES: nitrite reductase [Acidobacterium]ACO33815.1 nitrite reductase [Acidobacterium capsulatum ATCC 51196]HCT61801.1 nitrite reductase [Acidobacterium sp.]